MNYKYIRCNYELQIKAGSMDNRDISEVKHSPGNRHACEPFQNSNLLTLNLSDSLAHLGEFLKPPRPVPISVD